MIETHPIITNIVVISTTLIAMFILFRNDIGMKYFKCASCGKKCNDSVCDECVEKHVKTIMEDLIKEDII